MWLKACDVPRHVAGVTRVKHFEAVVACSRRQALCHRRRLSTSPQVTHHWQKCGYLFMLRSLADLLPRVFFSAMLPCQGVEWSALFQGRGCRRIQAEFTPLEGKSWTQGTSLQNAELMGHVRRMLGIFMEILIEPHAGLPSQKIHKSRPFPPLSLGRGALLAVLPRREVELHVPSDCRKEADSRA
jgi:hypothetical protein